MLRLNRKESALARLDQTIMRTAESLVFGHDEFLRVIQSTRAQSGLLKVHSDQGHPDPGNTEQIVAVCARLVRFCHLWTRPPETWHCPVGGAHVQLRSLIAHLFDHYPVPRGLWTVWVHAALEPWEVDLYLHMAAGRGIRQFSRLKQLPVTRSMARWFIRSPDDLPPARALRWAQVRALRGSNQLARLLSTSLYFAFGLDDRYRADVVQLLARESPDSVEGIMTLVQFLDAGRIPLEGMTLRSLRAVLSDWQPGLPAELSMARVTREPRRIRLWGRCAINPLRYPGPDGVWSIEELTSSEELRLEGIYQQHCVYSYVSRCVEGSTTIWSMQFEECADRGKQRILTIEVDPETRRIRQAKGRRNVAPDEPSLSILHYWATREGLLCDELA